jgi:poly(3-hydroxybutyrate) depolymerase
MPPSATSDGKAITLPKLGPGVHEQIASLPRGQQARYTISVPNQSNPKGTSLVVALHYGGKVTPFFGHDILDELFGPALQGLGAVLVSPDSLGGDWTQPGNEDAVLWLTHAVLEAYAIDPKHVAVAGYSMGAVGAWYLGSRHPDVFSAAIPVSGAPPSETEAWTLPACVVHSQKDEVFPIERTKRFVETLQHANLDLKWRELSGPTHFQVTSFAPALSDCVPWLAALWKL